MTSDNTKKVFVDIPLTFTQQCWKIVHRRRFANYVFNDNRNDNIYNFALDNFNLNNCVPAVVFGETLIYPYKSETFCVCQSQQNCQLLTEAVVFCRYCCKCLAITDNQNYINI